VSTHGRRPGRTVLLLTALAVLALAGWGTALAATILAGVAVTALVVARQRGTRRENRRLVAELQESQRTLQTLLRNLPGMAYRCRNAPDYPFEFASDGCLAVTGFAAADLAGTGGETPRVHYADLIHHEDREQVWDAVQAAVEARHPFRVHYRIHAADGGVREVWEQGRAVYDADGAVTALEGFVMDVTEQRRLESRLEHQAFHDPLTGLANRALFRDRVVHALAAGGRDGTRPAVIFLDLDDFKAVDSLGHAAGDCLLAEVAARLLNATRGCDTVARLGGDEFAVLVATIGDATEADVVAERIVRTLARPITIGGREVVARASLGVAVATPADTADELLRNADLAMYHAKGRGKGTCAHFAAEMYEAIHERVALEGDLRQAIARDEFGLAYQPIVDLATGRVVGVEALARWVHPERGAVSPARFVPVAEESGLVLPLGRSVLAAACRQAAAWHQDGADDLYVAVNISGRQLEDPRFVDDVAAAVAGAGLDPHALLLEITEGVLMQDTAANLARLAELKALGVRLAIDDFGTGYSSLAYLQRFPVDVLKIDKSFVDGVHDGGSHEALARTIIALGRTLSLSTVAEGVERAEQRAALLALGCTLGQGYLFSRPLPAAEVGALLTSAVAR
jgi:diguanylate cyclase (GGDEF)-like protein/PAS domain S-box-containing protein